MPLLFFPSRIYGAASLWQAVPFVTQASLSAGNSGGEGAQVIQNIAIDSTGNFLMMGTDVGGIYRSLDGGASWRPADVGYAPRGGCAFAIDPNNNQRVLAVGCNSFPQTWNGLWLSTNQAASWTPVLQKNIKGSGTYHDSVDFDASSATFQNGTNYSAVAYWVNYSDGGGGLWKSTDGGNTWSEIQPGFSDGIVKVNPSNGYVYVATANGLYRSTNGGNSFIQLITGPVLGLDVIATQPNNVYINGPTWVFASTNLGLNFTSTGSSGLPTSYTPGLRNLKVSPSNPNNMLIDVDMGAYNQQAHYYSTDGGITWAPCQLNAAAQSFFPVNPTEWLFAWSPTDSDHAWTCGGSFITQTADAGATFTWSSNGYNGYTCTGIFNFNPFNPGLLLMTSQDTNSAFTSGVTGDPVAWKYLNVSGQVWGGFTYGGYALSPSVMVAGNAASWNAPATLMVSSNGGGNWGSTGLVGNHTLAACGDPTNQNIAFWDQYRTTNGGMSWQVMSNCGGVFTYNSNPGGSYELYGANGVTVVKSVNHGATWTNVAALPTTVLDLACDWKNGQLYIATGNLYTCSLSGAGLARITPRLEADNMGNKGVYSVAVDPVDPDVAYAAWAGNSYISSQGVRRSLDGGATWTPLTLQPGDTGTDGGLEPECVRVHPVTRWLYSAGSCFGFWRYPPPTVDASTSSSPSNSAPLPIPNPARTSSPVHVQVSFNTGGQEEWLQVFTLAFREVNRIPLGVVNAGPMTVSLPLTDKKGTPLANGLYYLVIQPSNEMKAGRLLILR